MGTGPTPITVAPSPSRNSLFKVLTTTYYCVNTTWPNMTKDCWFCLVPPPPYYVGIRVMEDLSPVEEESECSWTDRVLALEEVQEQGICITSEGYNLDQFPYKLYHNRTQHLHETGSKLFKGLAGTWLACMLGLTPCLALRHFTCKSLELCIMVKVVPQVYDYSGQAGREHMTGLRVRRALLIFIPILESIGVTGSVDQWGWESPP